MRYRIVAGKGGASACEEIKRKFHSLEAAKLFAIEKWKIKEVDWLSIYDGQSPNIMPVFTEHDCSKHDRDGRKFKTKAAQDERIDALVDQLQSVKNRVVSREMVRIFLFRERDDS